MPIARIITVGLTLLGNAVAAWCKWRPLLSEDRSHGDDPLAGFGGHAARHVLRTDGFAHCPDSVLNSTYWAESEEVAVFE